MNHLWTIKLSKCSYSTLRFEFENFFGTNDSRTVESYIGRPPGIVHSRPGQSVRINRQTGKVAIFDYSNDRHVSFKRGLLQTLGYMTLEPEEQVAEQGAVRIRARTRNWIARIHHERMVYYTEQATLQDAYPIPEVNGDSGRSNDSVCACSVLGEETDRGYVV
jgi:hypothetical protein